MNNIQLHVGYIGITREGKRVEIASSFLGCDDYPWQTTEGVWYTYTGKFDRDSHTDEDQDIIGPWVETPVVPQANYNDGNWHRWDGATAECPVHTESVVEVNYIDGEGHTTIDNRRASSLNWGSNYEPILAFRVTKEYVAPVEPREFWIYQPRIEFNKPDDTTGYIHVKEVTNA